MKFQNKLNTASKINNSLLCVGLDTDLKKIPSMLLNDKFPLCTFNKAIIDATADLVCGYKPNSAFYEAIGSIGIEQLLATVHYIKDKYPSIPIILDAKRADIGNTNEGYVKFAFEYLGVDAITLHPYLGKEAIKPFLDWKEKGIIVICKTSNPQAGEFQDLKIYNKPLYQIVAEHVVNDWNYNGNCGLVVGATYPDEIKIVRRIVGNGFPLLIPGIGAQGGDVEKTVKAGIDQDGRSAIINSSRKIIFASDDKDFAERAREEAIKLKDEINKYRFTP